MIEMLSVDLSNYCSKQCPFCYNHSNREGNTQWKPQEVIGFASDCIAHGVESVSLGGGEPFEYEGIFEIIDALYAQCYLTVTSNGLPLDDEEVKRCLLHSKPDKIHLTIHEPKDREEVERVRRQVSEIVHLGIKPGINLLVRQGEIDAAHKVYLQFSRLLQPQQIILIPQRFSETPTPKLLASVASGAPFQSPSCLLGCKPPMNFASVSWDKQVNFCSYAGGKERLLSLDYRGLCDALNRVNFKSCLGG